MKIIELKEIKGNFYGGLPYSVSWDFNDGESPSKLKISVVNDKGKYGTPSLSFQTDETIQLDNFTFRGYLISFNLNSSVNQKTLDLEYVDKSIDLEKYFVVLYTKNADKFASEFEPQRTNLIIVGKPYHPCDKNMDSTLSFTNEIKVIDVDWCDPCPFMPPDKYKEACNPERANFEIFPVYYTFNELIREVKRTLKGFTIEEPPSPDKFIKRDYEGSLKSVLSSWCEELGLAYYFDPVRNTLKFVDRSKRPIQIPRFTDTTVADMIDLNTSESIENTFSRGYIATYSKAGEDKSYDCNNERIVTVRCLTTQDLYIDGKNPNESNAYIDDNTVSKDNFTSDTGPRPPPPPTETPVQPIGSRDASNNTKAKDDADVEELLTAVSYLGEPAHHAFTWFWYYQIKTASDAEDKYRIASYEEESTEEGQKKILRYFGNMKIRDVYSANNPDEAKRTTFTICKNKMDREKRSLLEAECKARGFTEEDPGYYFIVAEFNEEYFDEQVKIRTNRAENFLGKYWHKKFGVNFLIAGGNNKNGEITVECPDGATGEWYKENETADGLPIFGFGHLEKSKIGNLFEDILDNQNQIETQDKSYFKTLKDFGPESIDLRKASSSFVLINREQKWFPDKSSFSNYDSLFKWYSDVAPNVFNDMDGRPKFLFDIYGGAKDNANIKIFICRDLSREPDGAFDQVEFSTVNHPIEPKKRQQYTKDQQDAFGNTTVIKKGPWGLNGRKCVKIKLPGVDLFTPVQCFGNNDIIEEGYRDLSASEKQDQLTRDITGTFVDLGLRDGSNGTAGYRALLKAEQKFYKILPKLKYLYINPPQELKNIGKVDYSIKDLSSEQNMEQFKRNRCLISKDQFIELAKKYEATHRLSQSKPLKKANFKLAGSYPKQYTVEEGLVSVQITIGDDGVYTSYAFEDKIIKPPSDQVLADYMQFANTSVPVGGQRSVTSMDMRNYKVGRDVSRKQQSLMYDPNRTR
jgi:hypothetical protein